MTKLNTHRRHQTGQQMMTKLNSYLNLSEEDVKNGHLMTIMMTKLSRDSPRPAPVPASVHLIQLHSPWLNSGLWPGALSSMTN